MDLPDHHCPGCGITQKAFARYPWYFCQDCLALAEDRAGRRLDFGNASLSGGLIWRYADQDDWHDAGTIRCLIRNRPVLVDEARFGGVVAQPIPDHPLGVAPYNLLDLTRA